MSAKLAVAVIHWNVPDLLDSCLASIARQRVAADVLVVDVASPTDGHKPVVARHTGVRLVQMHLNRGYAAGCNVALVATDAEFVLLLNPDTELLPGAIENLLAGMELAPHIGLTAPYLLNPDGSRQSAGYTFPGVLNVVCDLLPVPARLVESRWNGRVAEGDGRSPLAIDYPLGAAMLVRRAAIEQVGELDESFGMYCEEIELCQRLKAGGWTVLLTPAAQIVHHGGQSTGQRAQAMREILWRSRAMYYRRFVSARKFRVIAALVNARTRLDDRNATEAQRAGNAAIRAAFAEVRE